MELGFRAPLGCERDSAGWAPQGPKPHPQGGTGAGSKGPRPAAIWVLPRRAGGSHCEIRGSGGWSERWGSLGNPGRVRDRCPAQSALASLTPAAAREGPHVSPHSALHAALAAGAARLGDHVVGGASGSLLRRPLSPSAPARPPHVSPAAGLGGLAGEGPRAELPFTAWPSLGSGHCCCLLVASPPRGQQEASSEAPGPYHHPPPPPAPALHQPSSWTPAGVPPVLPGYEKAQSVSV